MENLRYRGNGACCGAYAMANALQMNIDIGLFELSTGTPFGVKEDIKHEKRLITPLRDPNQNLDQAMALWGVDCRKFSSFHKREAVENLRTELEKRDTAIVAGPLNMGKLAYIPLSNVYMGTDHYIFIRKAKADSVEIVDSEEVLSFEMPFERFVQMWDVDEVPEAGGSYGFRVCRKMAGIPETPAILSAALNLMRKNLTDAEEENQGSKAFIRLGEFLSSADIKKYRMGLLYDLAHLMQKKLITMELMQEPLVQEGIRNIREVTALLDIQIERISQAAYELRKYGTIKRLDLEEIGMLERQISDHYLRFCQV